MVAVGACVTGANSGPARPNIVPTAPPFAPLFLSPPTKYYPLPCKTSYVCASPWVNYRDSRIFLVAAVVIDMLSRAMWDRAPCELAEMSVWGIVDVPNFATRFSWCFRAGHVFWLRWWALPRDGPTFRVTVTSVE